MGKLTEKQEAFVNEYLIDLNATQAALRAGYSEKTAYSQGQRLLKNVEIQTLIQKRMKNRSKRTEITADRVLEQLAKVAFSDMKDFMEWRTVQQITDYKDVYDDSEGKLKSNVPVVDQFTRILMKDSDEVDGTLVQEVTETNKGGSITHTMKLNDRMKALELLGKHLGLFNDKLDVTGDLSMKIEVDYGEDDE